MIDDRDRVDHSARHRDADRLTVSATPGEHPVVIAATPAQPATRIVERQPGHQEDIDLVDGDDPA